MGSQKQTGGIIFVVFTVAISSPFPPPIFECWPVFIRCHSVLRVSLAQLPTPTHASMPNSLGPSWKSSLTSLGRDHAPFLHFHKTKNKKKTKIKTKFIY